MCAPCVVSCRVVCGVLLAVELVLLGKQKPESVHVASVTARVVERIATFAVLGQQQVHQGLLCACFSVRRANDFFNNFCQNNKQKN